MVYLPQVMGCLYLQGALAQVSREREGLLARRYRAVVVSRDPQSTGHRGQRPSQPSPIVECPGQGLGLAQQGQAPPMLCEGVQRTGHSEAEINGSHPRVTVLREVREGLEGLL